MGHDVGTVGRSVSVVLGAACLFALGFLAGRSSTTVSTVAERDAGRVTRLDAAATPASAAELALLAPLAIGVPLGAWRIDDVRGVDQGMIRLLLSRLPHDQLELDVALDGHDPLAPPVATAGPYAVYYGAHTVSPQDAERAAAGLAVILEAHLDRPTPPGLDVFHPQPRAPVAL